MNRKLKALLTACAIICTGAAAWAQQKPYEPHAAKVTSISPDDSLKAFLGNLRAITGRSDLPAIEQLLADDIAIITCKPDPLAPCEAGAQGVKTSNPALTPAERLREGLCCPGIPADEITDELRSETIAGLISGAIESGQLSSHEKPGLVCSPAWPVYDRKKAAAIIAAGGASSEYLRYASQAIEVRAKPDPKAPVSATLAPGALVPMLQDVATAMPDGWYALAMPDGSIGFSDMLGLEELVPSGVCLRKDGAGWKIALIITLE